MRYSLMLLLLLTVNIGECFIISRYHHMVNDYHRMTMEQVGYLQKCTDYLQWYNNAFRQRQCGGAPLRSNKQGDNNGNK